MSDQRTDHGNTHGHEGSNVRGHTEGNDRGDARSNGRDKAQQKAQDKNRYTARDFARGLGWARIAFGAATYLLPRLSARLTTGPSKDLPAVAYGVRGMGARDFAVGLGAIRARTDREAAVWMGAAALIDMADTLTLLLAFRRLPLVRNLLFISLALGGAAAELHLVGRLRGE
jgi:hypothetical protein